MVASEEEEEEAACPSWTACRSPCSKYSQPADICPLTSDRQISSVEVMGRYPAAERGCVHVQHAMFPATAQLQQSGDRYLTSRGAHHLLVFTVPTMADTAEG